MNSIREAAAFWVLFFVRAGSWIGLVNLVQQLQWMRDDWSEAAGYKRLIVRYIGRDLHIFQILVEFTANNLLYLLIKPPLKGIIYWI